MSATLWPDRLEARLLDREPGLATACASADLDPVEQPSGVQDDRLLGAETLDLVAALLRLADEVARCGRPRPLRDSSSATMSSAASSRLSLRCSKTMARRKSARRCRSCCRRPASQASMSEKSSSTGVYGRTTA